MRDDEDWIARLIADGLLRRDEAALRTTKRWQAAMARAALRLVRANEEREDLRVPIAAALLELYGQDFDDDQLAVAVAVIAPLEIVEITSRRADAIARRR